MLCLFAASFFIFFNLLEFKPDILVVGFGKSGTTSLQTFFTRIGLYSAHWADNNGLVASRILKAKSNNLPLLHYLTSYDAITQMNVVPSNSDISGTCYFPQIEDFDQLYAENKDALFILNTRNISDHVRSFEKWRGGTFSITLYNKCPHLFVNTTGITISEKVASLIINHNENIRYFFKARPDAKFMEFQLGIDNEEIFKKFIDTKNVSFPHSNKSKN